MGMSANDTTLFQVTICKKVNHYRPNYGLQHGALAHDILTVYIYFSSNFQDKHKHLEKKTTCYCQFAFYTNRTSHLNMA